MFCKGECSKYAVKHSPFNGGKYESGLKRCSSCEIFMKYDGNRCPCCGIVLREKPRNSQAKEKILSKRN